MKGLDWLNWLKTTTDVSFKGMLTCVACIAILNVAACAVAGVRSVAEQSNAEVTINISLTVLT